jgi:tRNA A37 threonylcarbamoyltransferase TsaD
LTFARPDVASFFELSINCIVESVRDQVKSDKQRSIKVFFYLRYVHSKLQKSNIPFFLQHVILVGGFSASDWLLEKVDEALRPLGLNVIRPDSHVYVSLLTNISLL